MLIAMDLDEVLAETLTGVISFHNQKYGTGLSKDDFKSYNWWETWGGTRDQVVDKFFEFAQSIYFQEVKPLKDAVDAVSILGMKHELIVLSSRQTELEKQTLEWVEKHFPNKFRDVLVTNHHDWAKSGNTMTKVEVCQKLEVDVLIEDSLSYANECASENTIVFLLDYSWNMGKMKKNIIRVKSWGEILKHPILT